MNHYESFTSFSFGYNQQPFILFFSINLPFDNLYPVYYQKKDKYTSYELLNIFCKLQMNKKIIFATFLALSTNYYEICHGKTIKLLTKQTTLL